MDEWKVYGVAGVCWYCEGVDATVRMVGTVEGATVVHACVACWPRMPWRMRKTHVDAMDGPASLAVRKRMRHGLCEWCATPQSLRRVCHLGSATWWIAHVCLDCHPRVPPRHPRQGPRDGHGRHDELNEDGRDSRIIQ